MSNAGLPRPEPRADFRKRLRAELMSEAVALAEERRLRSRSLPSRLGSLLAAPRLRAVLVLAVLVVMLVSGAGLAAAGSLPGDPAFGLKRAAERVQLALATTPDARIRVLAEQAQHRLDELEQTVHRPDSAPTASVAYETAVKRLAAAVAALRAAQPGTRDATVEQVVEDARAKHVVILEELKQRLPPSAQQGIDRAIEEQEKLAPSGGRGEGGAPTAHPTRSPEPTGRDRDGRSPRPTARETDRPRESRQPRASETPRPSETARPSETPRASETPGGEPASESPHR